MTISSYGFWHVTTEGDCEGRSIRDLGVHQGHIDEIAFALASVCCYSLKFEAVDVTAWQWRTPATSVSIGLGINDGPRTWHMTPQARADWFREFLADRPVTVRTGMYFASVEITAGKSPEELAEAKRIAERKAALAKLTPDERRALGLE